jgi:hypothetical protein
LAWKRSWGIFAREIRPSWTHRKLALANTPPQVVAQIAPLGSSKWGDSHHLSGASGAIRSSVMPHKGGGRSGLSEAAPTRVFAVGLHECPRSIGRQRAGETGSGTDISTGADQVQHSCRPTSAPLLNWSHSSLFLPLLSSIPITGTPRGLIQQRDRSPPPCLTVAAHSGFSPLDSG